MPRLPEPPSADEIAAQIPAIVPLPETTARPFWSVMIPTYNDAHYLRKALASVLAQDPGEDQMQIAVIDDASPAGSPEAVVRELGGQRVEFLRNEPNRGATGTFNRCIEAARGHWVHILHADDMVLPDFYKTYRRLIEDHPGAVMVFGKVVYIDQDDRWQGLLGHLPPAGSAVLEDFVESQAVEQNGQFAGIVVRRSAYEQTGGFCGLFHHTADWDMWFRIGCLGQVVAPDRAYGMYREHGGSDTNKLAVSGANMHEQVLMPQINLKRLGNGAAENPLVHDWRAALARQAENFAWHLDRLGSTEGRLNQARWVWKLQPGPRNFFFYLKSLLKHKLNRGGPADSPGSNHGQEAILHQDAAS